MYRCSIAAALYHKRWVDMIIPFQKNHFDLFEFREFEVYTEEEKRMFVEEMPERSKMFTAVTDGRIVMIAGVVMVTLKTGLAFAMFSKYADQYPIATARMSKKLFRAGIESFGVHRLVAYNKIDAEHHHKWVEWLGFERECVVRKFTDEGTDAVQYGMIL